MPRNRHIGADAFLAQRNFLLAQYDHAKRLAVDNPVKTAHGVVGEAIVRAWLQEFLPKRYGVTKGFIITHSLEYDGPIEEWDIIVYDQIESPVLYVAESSESTTGGKRRGIPVEYVRGIIEVKSTFRPAMAKKMHDKLKKLRKFVGENTPGRYPRFLTCPFTATGIFFETKVKDYNNYRMALDSLTPLYDGGMAPIGFLILRSQTENEHCAYLKYMSFDPAIASLAIPELSSEFKSGDGTIMRLGCLGWGVNDFSAYIFDLVASLSGNLRAGRVSSFYGIDLGRAAGSWLFPEAFLKAAGEAPLPPPPKPAKASRGE